MFVDVSPVLALPFILPSQAQKHVTHNEALRILDALVQMSVASRSIAAPPASPVEGARFIVASAPTGAWAGRAGSVTQYDGNAWLFYAPKVGWAAWVADEAGTVVHDGTAWRGWSQRRLQVQELGVSATPDAQNRLSVSSPATLLNHAGAGHQLKMNKAAAGDTASVLFQTGFSGRAEMGLAGNDGFGVKSSADGATWVDALFIPTTGRPQLPQGVTVAAGTVAAPSVAFDGASGTGAYLSGVGDLGLSVGGVQRAAVTSAGLTVQGAITGTAVTQSTSDGTTGRLLKVGDFGIGGGPVIWPTGDLNDITVPSGAYYSGAALNRPAGAGWIIHNANGAGNQVQVFTSLSVPGAIFVRVLAGAGWTAWLRQFNNANVLGATTQTAGVPTGALIERASNANGMYARFADGTQICSHSLVGSTTAAVNWTYPAAFAAAPSVTGSVQATVLSAHCLDAAPGTTSSSFSARDKADVRRADTCRLMAIGRWF